MRSAPVWLCLVLLAPCCARLGGSDGAAQTDVLFPPDVLRAPPRPPAVRLLKRAQQGSRFALSLDVPTSILSVLMDLAKDQDQRSKAAANAQLMARIG
ncbi:hypothetical protein CRUP_012720 [Coryphaenoides rupestris]|nr:hypothetical protein CRUP_012720 [Coryphaenoides rupestris]